MQEMFMGAVMATTVGNFVTFLMVMLVLGMFSIKYESPMEVGVFASFIGYFMMAAVAIFGFLNGWVVAISYLIACIVVAIIQVSIFDIRRVKRIRESEQKKTPPALPTDGFISRTIKI